MLAGPNGSGKSTLAAQLSSDYAVNLYRFLNADLLFAEVVQSLRTACPFSIDNAELVQFVARSTYPREYKRPFESGEIYIDGEEYEEDGDLPQITNPGLAENGVKLGSEEYFVLGDNRNNSEDSRFAEVQNVDKKYIEGKVWFCIYPADKIGFVRQ